MRNTYHYSSRLNTYLYLNNSYEWNERVHTYRNIYIYIHLGACRLIVLFIYHTYSTYIHVCHAVVYTCGICYTVHALYHIWKLLIQKGHTGNRVPSMYGSFTKIAHRNFLQCSVIFLEFIRNIFNFRDCPSDDIHLK